MYIYSYTSLASVGFMSETQVHLQNRRALAVSKKKGREGGSFEHVA